MRQVLRTAFIVVALCSGLLRIATAEEPLGVERSIYPVRALSCPDALLRGCCDIYCPKPLPCLTCICHGCCKDDYCDKPSPCVPCYRGCSVPDCYNRKPCPVLCRPLAADYFTCAVGSAGCADLGAHSANSTLPARHNEVANRRAKRSEIGSVSP
jgi:hypothetical protein